MRWFREWRGVKSFTFSREMTDEELADTSRRMDEAFAHMDTAFRHMDSAFAALATGGAWRSDESAGRSQRQNTTGVTPNDQR